VVVVDVRERWGDVVLWLRVRMWQDKGNAWESQGDFIGIADFRYFLAFLLLLASNQTLLLLLLLLLVVVAGCCLL
jgi:hypothetical protein